MIDLHNNVKFARVLAPAAAATGARAGQIIDRQNYGSVEFVISHGVHTTTNVTVTPALLEGAVTGTLTTVAAADILGTIAGATLTGSGAGTISNKVAKLGYVGSKRYVQLRVTVTVAASSVVGAVAVLGNPRKAPETAQIT